jgi:hypothetical protein
MGMCRITILPALVRFAGEFGGVGRVGHDRRGHRAGQGQHTAIPGQVLPQVVDDQGQVGFVRFAGRGRVGDPGQAAQCSDDQGNAHINGCA